MNLTIFALFLGTVYVYINKYCTQTSATQCSNDIVRSFVNVALHLAKLAVKILSSALTIVRENPYNTTTASPPPATTVAAAAATTAIAAKVK